MRRLVPSVALAARHPALASMLEEDEANDGGSETGFQPATLRDGGAAFDAIVDLDKEASTAVFISAVDEGEDRGFDSGAVGITFWPVILYSYLLRVVMRHLEPPLAPTAARHPSSLSRLRQTGSKSLGMAIRSPVLSWTSTARGRISALVLGSLVPSIAQQPQVHSFTGWQSDPHGPRLRGDDSHVFLAPLRTGNPLRL